MVQSPLVSIIIPSRNRGKSLRDCLDGIQQQIFTDYEVLILDDGSEQVSRDESRELVKQYGERFQLHWIHPSGVKGSGAAFVRNQGIALSCGEYLAFCDDDDFWCQDDYLQQAVDALQQLPADVCFSGIKIHDIQGRVINDKMMRHVEQSLQAEQQLLNSSVYHVSREQILIYPDYAHLNITLVRKSLAEGIGGFWQYTPYAEDVGFFIQICDQANAILFRPDICAVHNAPEQRDDESVSNRMTLQDKRLLEISVYQRLLLNCQSSEALDYTCKSLANTLKMLTEELRKQVKPPQVISSYARAAWGIYPTIKWGLYALWLSLKALK